jgi:hypothetical protein
MRVCFRKFNEAARTTDFGRIPLKKSLLERFDSDG